MTNDLAHETGSANRRRWPRAVAVVLFCAAVVVAVAAWSIESLRSADRAAHGVDVAPISQAAASRVGVVSTHGEDFAYDTPAQEIVVCDEEFDSHPVKVELETADGTFRHLFDVSERRSNCTSLAIGQPILRHRVCEANLTWTCGNWQSTDRTVTEAG